MFSSIIIFLASLFGLNQQHQVPVHVATSSSPVVFAVRLEPEQSLQGEPFLVAVTGTSSENIKKVVFQNKTLATFLYKDQSTAIGGIDLAAKTGNYPVTVFFVDGTATSTTLKIIARKKVEAPLGIPQQLGGNTKEAEKKLIQSLNTEAEVLRNIISTSTRLWSKNFIYPIKDIFVTDTYGYSRVTGTSLIAHKGTDFRAAEGTSVIAMNDGVVRLAREFRAYGNLIAIDHGQGIVTLYLHLSKIKVREGERVVRGQEIGLSGKTGYAEGAHLHISVKVQGVSIDPITFMKLLGN
ncbi:MAG: M23 family metallopeptidase [Candidatus Taylorbacteria bacterium]|nr:M23 family metallopeptidase [Candidatus Taylorbacteria bacterium]